MPVSFDGRKNPDRRAHVEATGGSSDVAQPFFAFRKTSLTWAARINEPFEVDTIEGLHTGKAGDYLAVGAHGEMYPIDAAVFDATYEPVA